MNRVVSDYLGKRGNVRELHGAVPVSGSRCAVVIPAYDELASLPGTLDALPPRSDCAIVVVANYPAGAGAEAEVHHRKTIELLQKRTGVCYLDAPELSGGVGEARKLGLDSALPLLEDNGILFSLDADTLVEPNYFDAVLSWFEDHRECGGAVLDFAHRPAGDSAGQTAIDDYERYIRYFADGLDRVGSPYGYWAIGSAFAVRAAAYVRCGGMRVRSAGEDFYFLQALRKTTLIGRIMTTTVHPSSRISHRVPFGTGPKMAELLQGGALAYPPETLFNELEKLYQALERAPERVMEESPLLCRQFLEQEHFPDAWRKMLANTPKTHAKRVEAFHHWFDGLKIIRFLHWAADLPQ